MNEVSWEVLEEYFKEVLEGRSINSVLRALKREGYAISEGTLRARYKEWLAYQRAKKEFEAKLHQLKGEILKKTEDKIEELRETHGQKLTSLMFKSLNNTQVLEGFLGKETYKELIFPVPKHKEGLFWSIINDLEKNINSLQNQVETLVKENQKLSEQVHLLAKVLRAVLLGIYRRDKESGFFERKSLWNLMSTELSQEDVNRISEMAKNS